MNKLQRFIVWLFKIPISQTKVWTIRPIEPSSEYLRASGKTTRLVDSYIQLLFTTGAIEVFDCEGMQRSDAYLFDRIIDRLKIEHPGIQIDIRRNHIFLIGHQRYKSVNHRFL